MGMTIEQTNLLHKKAKNRKDGVYSFNGYLWVVKNYNFIAFCDYFGNVYQRFGAFNTQIGKIDNQSRRETLKNWLKTQ